MNKILTFLICFCLSFYAINAQNKQLRAYTLEDGLPQSQVYDMVQDNVGYLWLGTQGGGLCSFDGKSFDVFNENSGLLSNYVHALHTKNDTLFIGTKRGLSVKIKDRFFNSEAPQINSFFEYKNRLFLATKRGVYSVLNGKNLKKITIHPEIDTSSINAIINSGSFYWIATNNGLWKSPSLTKPKAQKVEDNNFVALLKYKDKLFASTFNDGTLVFEGNNQESVLIREPLRINALSIHNENELWIATDNRGISILDAENYNEKTELNRSSGLAVTHIRKIITDKQSNFWIATSGGGFYKYFQNNFKHFDSDTGLKGNRIYAVHHNKNQIWASNSEAGLVNIDSIGIHPIESPRLFKNVKIKAITSDRNGNIWVGSDGKGLWFREKKIKDSIVEDFSDMLDIRSDTLQRTYFKDHILNTDNGFPSDWIRKIHVDDTNTIWVATYSSGIVKFKYYPEKERLVIQKIFEKHQGIKDLLIKAMVKDAKGKFWYTTQNGHLGYIENDKVNHLGQVLKQSTAINSILFKNNNLFLGTAGQGIWWAPLSDLNNFKKLNGPKNTHSNNIYQLIFDDKGFLWAGNERGVDRIVLNQDNTIADVFHFGRNDGFLGIETCLNAVDKDGKGNLWFGAIYGLTQYKPSTSNKETTKPELFFRDIKVGYKSIDSLVLNTSKNKVLELNPDQTQVSFNYVTIDLDHPNEVQYRTKLNSGNWSPWSKERTQNLGLDHGAYTFVVQSRNYRWEQSVPKQYKFYINSPLYKKAWFQWLVIALAIAVLSWFTFRYVKGVKQKTLEEQERLKMENHLLTLEQKALRLQMNPHFIFNVLNGIKAMAVTKPDKMNNTINSFARLLRETLINSRKDTITLDQEIKTLNHYIEVEKLMATKPFNYIIKVNTTIDVEEILVPPMLIQPFVENAIRHGILKGKKDGELSINFNNTKNFLTCQITDNGIGIFQSQKAKQKTDHQSMALTVTRERLESISGKESLSISEIKNQDGTIGGTIIIFKIPLVTDY